MRCPICAKRRSVLDKEYVVPWSVAAVRALRPRGESADVYVHGACRHCGRGDGGGCGRKHLSHGFYEFSSAFPTTPGALQSRFAGGLCNSMFTPGGIFDYPCTDAFVIKLDPSGNVLFATYLGANGSQTVGSAICVDAEGNIFSVGGSSSANMQKCTRYVSGDSRRGVRESGHSGRVCREAECDRESAYLCDAATGVPKLRDLLSACDGDRFRGQRVHCEQYAEGFSDDAGCIPKCVPE